MPFGAIIGAVAPAIIGGLIGGGSSSDAANAQLQASQAATAEQQREFDQITKSFAPFLQTGQLSLQDLSSLLGLGGSGADIMNSPLLRQFTASDFTKSPGYDFQMKQGIDAIQNSAAAKGGVFSGNTLKSLDTFGQGLANQDWWNAYNAFTGNQNRTLSTLGGLANNGQNAAGNLGSIGTATANNIGSNLIQGGNAQAAGIVAGGNNLNNTIQSLFQNQGLQTALSGLFGGGGGGGSNIFSGIPSFGSQLGFS